MIERMDVYTSRIRVSLGEGSDMADITADVQKAVSGSGMRAGIAVVFAVGSTAGITTIEYEPGLLKDIPRALDVIAPEGADYEHHKTWHDDNGSAHVRSAVVGCSLTVPFVDGLLTLGTWQQITLINFDTRPRTREVVIQVLGG